MDDKQSIFDLPIVSNDPTDRLMNMISQYYPSFRFRNIDELRSYPVMNDWELLTHALRGAAGPFIELILYVDLKVGHKLNPIGFSNEEAGLKAKELVEEQFKLMKFQRTLDKLGFFYNTLGRAVAVETRDLNGNYYIDEDLKVHGVDSFNPMTLEINSIQEVMWDTTGEKTYKQFVPQGTKFVPVTFDQHRVRYLTKNPSDYSPYGNSDLQKCGTDLRLAVEFPHFRRKMARRYSELTTTVEVDSEKIQSTGGDEGKKVIEDFKEGRAYLDETAEFHRDLQEKSGVAAYFDWEKVVNNSWAGKEVNLQSVEDATNQRIAKQLQVPIALIDHRPDVNRDTLRTYVDTFVKEREMADRVTIYTPIIEETAANILEQNGITDGRLEVEYNPFLSKDYEMIANIISKLSQTGAITNPEIRDKMDWSKEVNLGGDEWKQEALSIMPIKQAPTGFNTPLSEDVTIKKLLNEGLEKGYIRGF